jgi:hypothetical protein
LIKNKKSYIRKEIQNESGKRNIWNHTNV